MVTRLCSKSHHLALMPTVSLMLTHCRDNSWKYVLHSADALANGLPIPLLGSAACWLPATDTASAMTRSADADMAPLCGPVEQRW